MSIKSIILNFWVFPLGLFILMFSVGNGTFDMNMDLKNYFYSSLFTIIIISFPVTIIECLKKIKKNRSIFKQVREDS
ncbi:hypothetical protein Brsp01_36430 [Brucella sp. NBRC 12950]|nr:hypothetical protein Brsp01_36430 [Brucella sp. NBRC 12950]